MRNELILLLAFGGLVVTAGCLAPKHWLPPLPHDKLLHFVAFGGLSLLAGRIAETQIELLTWLVGLLLAGGIIEGLQIFIPGRNFCWRDIAANTAGIVSAAACSRVVLGV